MSSTGVFYAAKDMLDPTGGQGLGGRKLYWGWTAYVSPAQGQMSLPREVTWHPELQQLVHSPLPEMAGLRVEPALASLGRIQLDRPAGSQLSLDLPAGLGRQVASPSSAGFPSLRIICSLLRPLQAEVLATFELPAQNTTVGVVVMAGSCTSSVSGQRSEHQPNTVALIPVAHTTLSR